jgi:hypothetical protein
VERKRLIAEDGVAFDQLASTVAIDGNTIVLGAFRADVGSVLQQGVAYVFERDAGGTDNWGQAVKLTDDSVGVIGNFGSSVALKGDLLAIGASRGGGNGQVTIFERDRGGAGAWGKVTSISDSVVGDGGTPLEFFGGAVALDGDLLLVGAPLADVSYFGEDDGAAYVFRRNATDRDHWDFVARLTAAEATLCTGGRTLAEVALDTPGARQEVQRCAQEDSKTDHDGFGAAIAIAGDIIAIGAANAEADSGPSIGAVYVFRQDATGADRWDQIAKLTGSDVLASTVPGFGQAVALTGSTLLVGAPGVEVGSKTDQGAAYVFERNAGGPDAWGEVTRLVAGDGLSRENFGTAVAFDNENGIIGASGYESAEGAVYLAGAAPPPPGPAFPSTGELTNGSVVEGAGGVLLGALERTLAAPSLPVWIQTVEPPTEPLPSHVTPRGSFYNIGAVSTTASPEAAPFAVALPVPEGADTGHLALAALAPPGRRGEGVAPEDAWVLLRGVYNSSLGLFSIVLNDLFIGGTTVVLIEDPDLTPLPPAAAVRKRSANEPEPIFDVRCDGWTTNPDGCGAADEEKFASGLVRAYDRLKGLGYAGPVDPQEPDGEQLMPALRHRMVDVKIPTDRPRKFELGEAPYFYDNLIKKAGESPSCPSGRGAIYIPEDRVIYFCYDKNTSDDAKTDIVMRHELFHAFQHDFANFHEDYDNRDTSTTVIGIFNNPTAFEDFQWISEGTATTAEDSDATLRRASTAPRDLHPTNLALTASDIKTVDDREGTAYEAQDFWVYVGLKRNLGLDYLKGLFRRGASPEDTDTFLQEEHQTTLGAEYWAWVKNQVIEKTINFDGNDACDIVIPRDNAVIGPVSVLAYPAPDAPPEINGTLPRLTAQLVRIVFTQDVGPVTITAGNSEGLAYKVYLNGESPCAEGIQDKERTFEKLSIVDIVYVVLANTQYQAGSRVEYDVQVTPAPSPEP